MNPEKLERNLEIVRLKDAGLSFGQIAEQMGISRPMVFKIYKRLKSKLIPPDQITS